MKKSWWKAVPRALTAAALMAMGACSTVIEGTDQTMTVITEPDGAQYTFSRDGVTVGAVVQTPSSLVVSKSGADMTVTCKSDGYMETSQIVQPEGSGWTAGNIIFGILGGGIGLIVDSATGANSKYPELVHVALIPESFPTEEERDRFFDARRAEHEKRLEKANQEVENRCRSKSQEICEMNRESLQKLQEETLAIVERERQAAIVENPATD